jgi:hypothetical protein
MKSGGEHSWLSFPRSFSCQQPDASMVQSSDCGEIIARPGLALRIQDSFANLF